VVPGGDPGAQDCALNSDESKNFVAAADCDDPDDASGFLVQFSASKSYQLVELQCQPTNQKPNVNDAWSGGIYTWDGSDWSLLPGTSWAMNSAMTSARGTPEIVASGVSFPSGVLGFGWLSNLPGSSLNGTPDWDHECTAEWTELP
jgi:hypothetical protein